MHTITIASGGRLVVDGEPLGSHVTYSEEMLLRAIMARSTVATKDSLLTELYSGIDEAELKIVDVFICKLRKKLGPHSQAVQTAWGRGFFKHPDYVMATVPDTVAVHVDGKLLNDAVFATGERADDLVRRLLRAELASIWANEASA